MLDVEHGVLAMPPVRIVKDRWSRAIMGKRGVVESERAIFRKEAEEARAAGATLLPNHDGCCHHIVREH